ncbi:hypothetical protein GW17_00016719 [Ensete ventricosum]|uniref:Uncharacterized protein n=1 Tax=Ensete ventricosum TaxID=4639 RepID=A0A427A8Y4_ENSVE|nr:hypothetical protein B296_00034277 [Ensete ventricosum]RWW19247.1 hypothetical protein GW17_00016719 [Ensete ventricosum]RZS11982.1 hypothetical protein BHM03_00043362 [Ensete ventricosum]
MFKSVPEGKHSEKRLNYPHLGVPAQAPAAAWQRSPLVVRLWVSAAIEGIRAEDESIEAGAPTENLGFLSREGRSGDPASHGLEIKNQGAPRKEPTRARRIEQQEEDQISIPIGSKDCGATPLSEGRLLCFLLHLLLTSVVGCFPRRLSHDARRGNDWIRKRHWSLDSIPTAAGKS